MEAVCSLTASKTHKQQCVYCSTDGHLKTQCLFSLIMPFASQISFMQQLLVMVLWMGMSATRSTTLVQTEISQQQLLDSLENALKCCTNIHGPQRVNPTEVDICVYSETTATKCQGANVLNTDNNGNHGKLCLSW